MKKEKSFFDPRIHPKMDCCKKLDRENCDGCEFFHGNLCPHCECHHVYPDYLLYLAKKELAKEGGENEDEGMVYIAQIFR